MLKVISAKEDELLSVICIIDSYENAGKYQSEFHSKYHAYPYDAYLNILARIIDLLKKGYNNVDENINLIKNGIDILM